MIVPLVLFSGVLTDIISRRFETRSFIEFIKLYLVSMIVHAISSGFRTNCHNVIMLATQEMFILMHHV